MERVLTGEEIQRLFEVVLSQMEIYNAQTDDQRRETNLKLYTDRSGESVGVFDTRNLVQVKKPYNPRILEQWFQNFPHFEKDSEALGEHYTKQNSNTFMGSETVDTGLISGKGKLMIIKTK